MVTIFIIFFQVFFLWTVTKNSKKNLGAGRVVVPHVDVDPEVVRENGARVDLGQGQVHERKVPAAQDPAIERKVPKSKKK